MASTLDRLVAAKAKLTPMMEQYYSIKKNYPEHLLLFRMGDFYEAFFEDATQVSQTLSIALTHRGKIGQSPIPMAGIPHHAAGTYVDRLTGDGKHVAICEQVEEASEAKGIVKRAVTQVVGPGIPYDFDKVEGSEQRYLAAGWHDGEDFSLVSLDFTTGEFIGQKFSNLKNLLDQLGHLPPKELITFMGQWEQWSEIDAVCESRNILKTHLSAEYFESKHTRPYLDKLFPAHKWDRTLDASASMLFPMGALAYYVFSTQQLSECVHIRPFRLLGSRAHLKVTLPTLVGLEILPQDRASYKRSLLGFLDCTQTAMGSRRLRDLVTKPLKSRENIIKRQNLIHFFLQNDQLLTSMRTELKQVCDIERVLAKVSTRKAHAGDLLNLARTTLLYSQFEGELQSISQDTCFVPLDIEILKKLEALACKLKAAVNDEMGASLDKGNLIKLAYHTERDRLSKLNCDVQSELTRLEQRYRKDTGIAKLRIKSNNIAGYFVEVSKNHAAQMPSHFVLKQTLVNGQRYTTEELQRFEKDVLSASEKLRRLEQHLFAELLDEVGETASCLHDLSDTLAMLDCFLAMTWVCRRENLVRPVLKKRKTFSLRGMWHPLMKAGAADECVAHDLVLDQKHYFGLITGPNMAGKTTAMREMAMVQILAQIGCYVPAEKAEVSLCDYLFGRLGANDDILRGQSTFMVEMSETAEIVRHATSNSMVILDEVGRGTSTYDGLAIAWALVEHLVTRVRALGLFATHYHELIDVAENLAGAKNFTMETRSCKDDVQFLYRLIEGSTNQSFGIYVAKLAGLPPSLISRGQTLLAELEGGVSSQTQNRKGDEDGQLCLNWPTPKAEIPTHLKELESKLAKLDLARTTPLEALNQLHVLQNMIKGKT